MNFSNYAALWIGNTLFIIGVILLFIGVGFILFPDKIFKLAGRLNFWVNTESFFNRINKPRYKEVYFYRHHKIFGAIIFISTLVCLYTMVISIGIESTTNSLMNISKSEFEGWLFVNLYYILIFTNILAVIFGIIMIIRPSALKTFEIWSNHWVDTDSSLKKLDAQKDLPDRILPGNPRIFGLFIIFGAIYIMWMTNPL